MCEDDELVFWQNAADEREWCRTCGEGFRKPDCRRITVETDGQNPQHPAVLNAFAANILRGEPMIADGREGIRGLMLSNAMHLSSWLKQAVTLPIDEALFRRMLEEKCRNSRSKEDRDVTISTEGSY